MNCNEITILMQFLLRYNDNNVYTRARPYDQQESMMINKDIKDT